MHSVRWQDDARKREIRLNSNRKGNLWPSTVCFLYRTIEKRSKFTAWSCKSSVLRFMLEKMNIAIRSEHRPFSPFFLLLYSSCHSVDSSCWMWSDNFFHFQCSPFILTLPLCRLWFTERLSVLNPTRWYFIWNIPWMFVFHDLRTDTDTWTPVDSLSVGNIQSHFFEMDTDLRREYSI